MPVGTTEGGRDAFDAANAGLAIGIRVGLVDAALPDDSVIVNMAPLEPGLVREGLDDDGMSVVESCLGALAVGDEGD